MDLAGKNYKPLLIIVSVLVFLLGFYMAISGYMISVDTGILVVNKPKGSDLAIYRDGYEVTDIGSSKTKIRLAPGKYEVIVTANTQTIRSITVQKKETTNLNISLPLYNNPLDKNTAANNLIKLLPIVGPAANYQISYSYTYTNLVATPVIIVTAANATYEQQAMQWITAHGFKLNQLTINYSQQTVENYHYTNGIP